MKNLNKSSGFSLIELLLGVAIIITATTVVLAIIVSSFRISSKNTSNEIVRQNGNYASSQISKTVQFASKFVAVTDDGTFTDIVPICEVPSDNPTQYKYLRVVSGGQNKTFACVNNEIRLNGVSMVDKSKITVPTETCYFTCSQDTTLVAPVVGINYDLVLGNEAKVSEKSSRINFSTKVKMRNL